MIRLKEENINKKSYSKMKKFWVILASLLVLLIPTGFLFGIIDDRENYRSEAVTSVASSWGDAQVLEAPSLYFERKVNNQPEYKFLELNDYNANINITTEVRKKGLFKIPVYTADVRLKGSFKNEYGDLNGKKMTAEFKVSDTTGFIEEPVVKLDNKAAVKVNDIKLSTNLKTSASEIPFEISYKIRGLNEIYVKTDGLSNKIKISGNWKDPSFTGNFLPSARTVENNKFSAEWSIPRIAASGITDAKSGVSLLMPVDNYRMAARALKYAFLFLTLTFLTYFIYEITSKAAKRIHPLQYTMLGGAMLMFYLLLLSLSEFMAFAPSYIISAAMVISLTGFYTHFVITKGQNPLFAGVISFIMTLLYSFLYILLSLQDFALLIGSFGLFIILAGIMYTTRNVDWYNEDTDVQK